MDRIEPLSSWFPLPFENISSFSSPGPLDKHLESHRILYYTPAQSQACISSPSIHQDLEVSYLSAVRKTLS